MDDGEPRAADAATGGWPCDEQRELLGMAGPLSALELVISQFIRVDGRAA
jgi:hypothetical protein